MTIINVKEIRDAVLAAIEEKGEDYVYPHAGGTCVYFEEGPSGEVVNSCGIGYAIDTLGLRDKAIGLIMQYKIMNGARTEPSALELLDTLGRESDDVRFTASAVRWAQTFQQRQDDGAEWGIALSRADLEVGYTPPVEPATTPASSSSSMAERFGAMHSTTKHDPTL